MFGVVDDLAASGPAGGDRFADHGEIFVAAGTKYFVDVQVPAFADDGNDGRLGVDQGPHARVGRGLGAAAAGHAEGADAGVDEAGGRSVLEKGGVFGVRERITALDEVETERIELVGDVDLIDEAECNALALSTIAEGGVVKLDSAGVCGHGQVLRGGPAGWRQPAG